MNNSMHNINRLFNVIDQSLFMITGKLDYDRITDAIILLSNHIDNFEGDTESIWWIGECGDCMLTDLIVGAFWHFTEWHAGQNSKSYAALCALGQVFSPGMETPEEDNAAYIQLNSMADLKHY